MPEINEKHDTTEKLSSRQLDCARLIATSPGRSKQDIASSLKISRRTVFRWLTDEVFQKKIEEFRRSKIVTSDAKSIYGMLSVKDRKELLSLLLGEKENRHLHLPEIAELENKIMEVAKNDDDPMQEKTRKAIEKVERLLGRLKRNVLCSMDYQQDGSPVEQTRREIVSEWIEMLIVAAGLEEDKQLGDAITDILNLITTRIGEDENRDQEFELSDEDEDEGQGDDDLGNDGYNLDNNTDEWIDKE